MIKVALALLLTTTLTQYACTTLTQTDKQFLHVAKANTGHEWLLGLLTIVAKMMAGTVQNSPYQVQQRKQSRVSTTERVR